MRHNSMIYAHTVRRVTRFGSGLGEAALMLWFGGALYYIPLPIAYAPASR